GVEPAGADEGGRRAVGLPGTAGQRIDLAELRSRTGEAAVREAVESFVLAFSSAVARRATPRFDALLAPGVEGEATGDLALSTRRGVAWVSVLAGSLAFDGEGSLAVGPEDGPFPLAAGAWVRAAAGTRFRTLASGDLGTEELWIGVRTFQRVALEWADLVLERDRRLARERLGRRLLLDREANEAALRSLADVIAPAAEAPVDATGGPLLTACRLIGKQLRLDFAQPPTWERTRGSVEEEIRALCRASAIGQRRVVMSPGWWTRDNGPLLGIIAAGGEEGENAASGASPAPAAPASASTPTPGTEAAWEPPPPLTPVALLVDAPGRYSLADPLSGRRTPVDENVAAALAPFGFQLYRPLPAGPERLADIWRIVTFGAWKALRTLLVVGAVGAGLGLLLPILTGVVFDQVIPGAERGQLVSVFVALAVAALASAAFEITRAFAITRLHTRVSSEMQLAVYHRLVRLPLPFFRHFSAGDLGTRASGISAIGNTLSGATISSVLGAVVSGGSYVLLFVYSPVLALVATVILAVNVTFTAATGYYALRFAREREAVDGKLSGLVLQLLTGIAKLRVSGTEARAFARWSLVFRRQRDLVLRVGRFNNNVQVFNAVLSILSTLVIYWAYMVLAGRGGLTTGQFLAFNSAFGTFIAAGLSVMATGIGLLELVPLWERARPILDEEPESDPSRPGPGELSGRIEVSHLPFRYSEDGPVILQDVCVHAEPGEFIGVVGPSGAGKSPLLRLLLAFDTPETSSVYYDGHDLATIDVTGVRRQIGVVLQSSKLTAGDIYSNIVGASALPVETAWEAARMAGLEDDLRQMPMGIHTVVAEGGGTLSGGQRQRLLIARALVHRPRILFFDEATSALDNRTQRIVSDSIEQLHATRVVIAHRLSTIQRADRIYVMDHGRVVQAGTFAELMSQPGLFAELAARQEA
ncbi:MAG: NHLP bacteriocin export ABC transporter permease/ATPase subunit, partial [Gemmatimonadetes bacterium]|nr:NHLP bacteriocin export ABC transporter permease/ATPase subunit [Gemmatimonadota bacterium]